MTEPAHQRHRAGVAAAARELDMKMTFTSWIAGCSLAACVGQELTVGERSGDPASDPPPGSSVANIDPTQCRGLEELRLERGIPEASLPANFGAIAGAWRGELEGPVYYFGYHDVIAELPRGPVELSLDADGNGSVRFAQDAVEAVPPSAEDPYLCRGATISGGCRATAEVVAGFRYSVGRSRIVVDDDGLRAWLNLWLSEPWQGWCELQAPRALPRQCAGDGDVCSDAGLPCGAYVASPDPALVDLDACSVVDGAAPRGVACDWLAAVREAPCVCAEEGCSSAGLVRTLELALSADGQLLRGRVLEAPLEVEREPLVLERQ